MRLQNIIILQNKVDLIKEDAAIAQHDQIRKFVAGTVADQVRKIFMIEYFLIQHLVFCSQAPIIPISAVLKYNIDVVVEYLVRKVCVSAHDDHFPDDYFFC